MKLAELRALPLGAPLLAGPDAEPVVLAGIAETPQPRGRVTCARVRTWDGYLREVPARQLSPAPPAPYRDVVMVRPDLTGHTVTIERITAPVWSRLGLCRGSVGQLAVIQRQDGRFVRVCCLASDIWGGGDLETAAEAYADECGGTYLPAGGV